LVTDLVQIICKALKQRIICILARLSRGSGPPGSASEEQF